MLFLLFSRSRSSCLSVVFDFNESLIDVIPVFSMRLPVDLLKMEKDWTVGGCHLLVVSFVFTIQIELFECCV